MMIKAKVHTTQEGSRPVSQERRLLWLTEEPGRTGGRAAKCSAVFLGVCSVTPTHPSIPWETGVSHTAEAWTFEHTSDAFPPLLEGSREQGVNCEASPRPTQPWKPHPFSSLCSSRFRTPWPHYSWGPFPLPGTLFPNHSSLVQLGLSWTERLSLITNLSHQPQITFCSIFVHSNRYHLTLH